MCNLQTWRRRCGHTRHPRLSRAHVRARRRRHLGGCCGSAWSNSRRCCGCGSATCRASMRANALRRCRWRPFERCWQSRLPNNGLHLPPVLLLIKVFGQAPQVLGACHVHDRPMHITSTARNTSSLPSPRTGPHRWDVCRHPVLAPWHKKTNPNEGSKGKGHLPTTAGGPPGEKLEPKRLRTSHHQSS